MVVDANSGTGVICLIHRVGALSAQTCQEVLPGKLRNLFTS